MPYNTAAEIALLSEGLIDDLLFVLASFSDDLGAAIANGLGALAHPARRRVLELLSTQGVTTRERLAEDLAEDPGLRMDDFERMRLELHHRHLPKLDHYDYLEYDYRSGDVRLWKDPESVREELEH